MRSTTIMLGMGVVLAAQLGQPRTVLAQYREPVKTPSVYLDLNVGGVEDPLAGEVQFESRFLWFGEVGRRRALYPRPSNQGLGALVDVGSGLMLSRHLGVGVSYGRTSRTAAVALEVDVPHPAYLDAAATVGDLSSGTLVRREAAWHLDAVLMLKRAEHFEIRAFGGPSFITYSADLVRSVAFAQAASPASAQQTVTITGTETERVRERTVGLNAGADLSLFPRGWIGVGLGVRLTTGTVDLDPEPMSGRPQELRVGNVIGFVGLRVRPGR